MGLRTIFKTAGHWLKGSIVKVDSEIQFDTTTNPEIDSTGGDFVWNTKTTSASSWKLRDPGASEDIIITDTSAKTFTLHSSYTASGFGEPAFSKNTAFNKNFGTTAGTVLEGDTSIPTYFKTQIIMPSAPVAISGSASNQAVTGLSYTIVTAGDYVFYAMVTADIGGPDAKPFSVTIYKNGVEELNSRFGDFAKKNEAQSIATTYPISGLVATDVIAVYIDNDNIDCDILLGRLFVQSWG